MTRWTAILVAGVVLLACGEDGAAGDEPATHPNPTSLVDCLPATLDGIAIMGPQPSFGGAPGPFARAYLSRESGRAININIWDDGPNNLEGQLTQFPVIGQDGERRGGTSMERVGGTHRDRPSEASWMTMMSTDGHRDTFTVLVSDTRLVSLSVEPDVERGDAQRLFEQLDFECLRAAPR